MKIYRMPQLAESAEDGAYRLGSDNARTASTYLTYSRLKPRETGRKFETPDGFEEIIYVVKGALRVSSGRYKPFSVAAGEAFTPCGPLLLDNSGEGEAAFITAGARTTADARQKGEGPCADAGEATAATEAAMRPPDAGAAEPQTDEGDEFEISR